MDKTAVEIFGFSEGVALVEPKAPRARETAGA